MRQRGEGRYQTVVVKTNMQFKSRFHAIVIGLREDLERDIQQTGVERKELALEAELVPWGTTPAAFIELGEEHLKKTRGQVLIGSAQRGAFHRAAAQVIGKMPLTGDGAFNIAQTGTP